MGSQMNTKVRFVKCPKCQLVLPEFADVPVYKCGGCGTILQAKKRKSAPIKDNGLDLVSQEKEIRSKSQEASPPLKGDDSLNKWKNPDKRGAEDCKKELPQQINSPNELPSSSGLSYLEKEDPLSNLAEHEGDEHSCALEEKTERYDNENRDHEKEFPGGGNFSSRLPSSDQHTCHESGSPVSEAKEDEEGSAIEEREQLVLDKASGCPPLEVTEELELDEDHSPVDHCPIKDQNECGVGQTMLNSSNENSTLSECINHRNEVSIGSGAHEDGTESQSPMHQSTERGQGNTEPSENVSYAKETSSSAELARDEIEKQSSVSSDMDQSPLNESTMSDTHMSTDHEQIEQFQRETPSGFDRISSVDTLENLPLNIRGSEPRVNLRDMIKSPTNKGYYDYDGSASSCDGDDHRPNQLHQQPGRKFKEAYPVSPSEFTLDNRCRVNNKMSSDSKIPQRAMEFSTTLPGKSRHAEGSNWSHDEWPQSRRRVQASGSKVALEKDEHATVFPFLPTGPQTAHKHGNPSSYRKNVAPHSSLHPSRTPSNPDPDKIELLRIVYELEDQLRQTRVTKRVASRPFSTEVMRDEEYIPSYCDQLLPGGEVIADLNYSRYPVRCSQGKGWPQQLKSSRIPFSAEAAPYRHQADCLCLHCSPQVRHCSAQLHPSVLYNKGRRVAYSSYNYFNHLHSGSSSPQHNSSSEYTRWDLETISDDRRYEDHERKKLYLREKYSKMRHLRPVAGGAPIIACYYCSELLQLPADFLLFKRRCHQLRCNACRKVLKFSLQRQIHVIPFNTEAALAPPPSEVDEYSDAIDQQNLAFAYHSNSCPHTDPISCSDDLGPSFCRSCSTEGESSLPPIRPIGRTSFNREMSASSSSGPTKDRKMKSVLTEPHRGTFGSPGPSAKMSKWGKTSSEIEEVRPSAGSPLHRLMGYSSPSEVIHW